VYHTDFVAERRPASHASCSLNAARLAAAKKSRDIQGGEEDREQARKTAASKTPQSRQ